MALSLSVGKTYNFSTHAPARLGQEHKAMIVTSQLVFTDAIKLCPSLVETFKIVSIKMAVSSSSRTKLWASEPAGKVVPSV